MNLNVCMYMYVRSSGCLHRSDGGDVGAGIEERERIIWYKHELSRTLPDIL